MKTPIRIIALFVLLIPNVPYCFGQSMADSSRNSKPPNPPIPIEAFSSDKILNIQLIMLKHFSPDSKFGFLNVNYITGDYQNNKMRNEYESLSFLTADLFRGFSVLGGVMMNYYYGFRPTVGLQYVFATPRFLAVILPHIDLTETNNFETIGLFEYKPKFNKDWGLYTRVQGLYNYNVKYKSQDRSYVYSRVGISYRQYAMGLGANMDWYGPLKINQNSYGAFVRAEIF